MTLYLQLDFNRTFFVSLLMFYQVISNHRNTCEGEREPSYPRIFSDPWITKNLNYRMFAGQWSRIKSKISFLELESAFLFFLSLVTQQHIVNNEMQYVSTWTTIKRWWSLDNLIRESIVLVYFTIELASSIILHSII
jgi:hypothetical protein